MPSTGRLKLPALPWLMGAVCVVFALAVLVSDAAADFDTELVSDNVKSDPFYCICKEILFCGVLH